jgi:hypothetical protein
MIKSLLDVGCGSETNEVRLGQRTDNRRGRRGEKKGNENEVVVNKCLMFGNKTCPFVFLFVFCRSPWKGILLSVRNFSPIILCCKG